MKRKSPRHPGMTQISISLPQDLVERVDEAAKADRRNRSNFIANCLEMVLSGSIQQGLQVAEPAQAFKPSNRK